eukprot:Phypoly_transcript_06163.p1 GENE.Phypoly_transcript_06163~~Phypoly_transcript_06163.p1  ORF type:complete len:375 (+),score=45.58 Phypoly_transcript_06163:647-1771(+)
MNKTTACTHSPPPLPFTCIPSSPPGLPLLTCTPLSPEFPPPPYSLAYDQSKEPTVKEVGFEERYASLVNTVSIGHPFLICATMQALQSIVQLNSFTKCVMLDGGEGSVLRMQDSPYVHGRSSLLLKFKAYRMSLEARVLQLVNSENAVKLLLANGKIFTVKLESFMANNRAIRLQKDDIITFSFSSRFTSSNIPIAPKFIDVCPGLIWNDLVQQHMQSVRSRNQEANALTARILQQLKSNNNKPSGYWTRDEGANVRRFFIEFAHSRSMDPLLPETWYSVSTHLIASKEGGVSAMKQYAGLANSIIGAFPNIGLDPSKFRYLPRSYWQVVSNRKNFFDSFATKCGFDPLEARKWYDVSSTDVMSEKVLFPLIGI